ncbi:MAG: preprotein translocase subunit SecE [Deltaproteobacteria bacterium]|nr:preprotein translocase subunit SecE [Deltaproteobacteria bacterium]
MNSFGLEVISELGKVTWPTQKETVASTGVILVMVAIASGILFVFDTVWSMLTRLFLEL